MYFLELIPLQKSRRSIKPTAFNIMKDLSAVNFVIFLFKYNNCKVECFVSIKLDTENTFLKLTVVDDSDILDVNALESKHAGDDSDTAGLIHEVNEHFIADCT